MTTKKPRKNHKLDREIDRLYRVHAVGKQIDIMDIGKVFKAGEEAHAAGTSVEEAVKAAVAKYCTPSGSASDGESGCTLEVV